MGILKGLDPKTNEYGVVLSNLYNLYNLKRDVDRWSGSQEPIDWEGAEQTEQTVPSEPKTVVTDDVIIESTTEPVTEYTKEYVRDLLLKARDKGHKVESIIEAFTPEGKASKFSSIPSSKYPELVEELKKYA